PAGRDERPAARGGAEGPLPASRRAGRAGPSYLLAVSTLRARCPECRTLTAVALEGGEYECHSCGRTYRAGLVRGPNARGGGGEAVVEAAFLELPYPEAGVVDEDTLTEQSLALACSLPERPLVMGGCCCAHVGAVDALRPRGGS